MDEFLRLAEEQREAADAYMGHSWFADERDPDDEEEDDGDN